MKSSFTNQTLLILAMLFFGTYSLKAQQDCEIWCAVTQEFINVCSDCDNVIAADDCADAAKPYICELDGFATTTCAFTADGPGLLPGFCGNNTIVHNNIWIGFTPAFNGLLHLNIEIINCLSPLANCNGIQAAVCRALCANPNNTFFGFEYETLDCVNCVANTFDLITNDAIAGVPHYVMIDGCCGDACEIVIHVIEGLPDPGWELQPITGNLCPSVLYPDCGSPQSTASVIAIPNAGVQDPNATLVFTWYDTDGNVMAETNGVSNGTSQSSTLFGINPNTGLPYFCKEGEYLVTVKDFETCCEDESSAPFEFVQPPGAVAAFISSDASDFNCDNNEITMTGAPDDPSIVVQFERWDKITDWTESPVETSQMPQTAPYNSTTDELTIFLEDSPSGAGVYMYQYIEANAFCISEGLICVPADTIKPVIDIDTPAELDCATNPTVTLDATGSVVQISEYENCDVGDLSLGQFPVETLNPTTNYTVLWTSDDGHSIANDNTLEPTVTNSGWYTCQITNEDNNCVGEARIFVDGNVDPPVIDAIPDVTIDCTNNFTLDVTATHSNAANATYTWEDSNGGAAGTGPMINVSDADTYTVTVQNDDNMCVAQASFTVTRNDDTPSIDPLSGPAITCTETTSLIDATVTGSGDFTYSWLNSADVEVATTEDFTAPSPGDYTLVVTDNVSGCSSMAPVTIAEDGDLPQVSTMPELVLNCNNSLSVSQTASAVDPTGANMLVYEWFDASDVSVATGTDITVTTEGLYTVVVSNPNNGCSSTETLNVILDNDMPSPDAGMDQELTCTNGQEVTLDGTASSGTGNLTYAWSGPGGAAGTSSTLTATVIGTYTLIITDDSNGCTDEATVDVTENVTLPSPDAGLDQTLTCDNNQEVELDGSASSGIGTLSYSWSGPNGASGTSPTLTATAVGVYTLTIVDDANGCEEMTTVEVTENVADPDVTPSGPVTLTCDNPNGLDISASSTIPGVTYAWESAGFDVGTTPTITATTAGTYTVIVTNPANGCTNMATVEVSNSDSQPTVVVVSDPTTRELNCDITSYELLGTNTNPNVTNVTFEWTGPNGPITGNPITITEPGDYTVVATNTDNGCVSQSNADFFQNIDEPDVVLMADEITCDNDEVEIIAVDLNDITGTGTGWSWQGPNGFSSNLINPMITEAGTYTVTASAGNGCESEASIVVTEDVTPPTAIAAPDFTLTCNQDSYELMGSSDGANNTYEWNGPAGYNNTTANPTIDAFGLYILTVTNPDNGCEETTQVDITQDFVEPTAVVPGDLTIDCNSDNADLMGGTGPATDDPIYLWTLPDGTMVNDQMVNATVGGQYTLTVTDMSNGCSMTQMVNVTEDFDEPVPMAEGGQTTCADPTINLQGETDTPGSTFEWTGPGGFSSTEQNPSASAGGDYTLTVTGPNGCMASALTSITADENIPEVTPSITDGAVLNCNTMQVELVADGNVANAVYTWTLPNGMTQTGSTIFASEAGNYEVNIFNPDNGCDGFNTIVVPEDFELPEVATQNGVVTCLEPETMLDGSSTTPNATYLWTGPNGFMSTDQNPTVTEGGMYNLEVTDPANGCVNDMDLEIMVDQDNPAISVDYETESELDCNNPMLGILGASTTAGVEFLWTGPNGFTSSNETEEISEPGTYILTITNPMNSCVSTEMIEITADFDMPAITGTGNLITCQELTVDVMVSSDENIDSYSWTGPNGYVSDQQNPDDIVESGDYTVVIVAADNGCSNTTSVTVDIDQGFPAVAATGTEINCLDPMTTLSGVGSAEGATITYEWTLNGTVVSTDLTPMVDAAGVYTLTVFDSSNGCQESADYEVIADFELPTADAGDDAILTCAEDTEIVTAVLSTGQGTLSYEWVNSAGATIGTSVNLETAETGIFTLTVTDSDNGCQATDQVMIDPDENAPVAIVPEPATITCDVQTVTLDASGSTSQGTLEYEWIDANNNSLGTGATLDVTSSGSYTVLLVDASNGCDASILVTVPEDLSLPQFAIAEPDPIDCTLNYTNVDLEVTSGSNPDFSWEGPGGFSATTEDLDQVDNPGMYSVTVTDTNNGCVDMGQVAVAANEDYPLVAASADDEFDCTTDEVTLSGAGTTPGLDYTWEGPQILSGATTLDPVVGQPGTYTLTVVDNDNGCESTADVMVLRNETEIEGLDVAAADANCFGPNTGSIVMNAVQSGTEPFLYSIDGGNSFSAQLEYLGLAAGTYPVVVEDALGCIFETEAIVGPAIELDLELTTSDPDNVIAFGDSLQLFPETNFDIDVAAWNDSTLFGVNPWAMPLNTTTYSVITYDENGCQKEDNVTIFVEKTRPVYIPSVFSPNGDGVNDTFTVFADADLITEIKSLDVYDRWGGHMFTNSSFRPNDESEGWDGYHPRKKGDTFMQPGVFVYYALVEFVDGEVILYEGDVTIMR